MEALSELGVLFLLFEMGLELSLDRLKVCLRVVLACMPDDLQSVHGCPICSAPRHALLLAFEDFH